ncbi:FimV/HubP family polar landmark protein [Ectopseudomonas mendocina]|uniref:FimV/HubP family polar landmark protein n=1 Tax=Ectopseudomonas mendocina TaxID=300 RepID=A0ABZ2RMJ8_ECTME
MNLPIAILLGVVHGTFPYALFERLTDDLLPDASVATEEIKGVPPGAISMEKVRHLLIGLASSSVLYSGFASALGLGDITLNSALSQPLDAEIKLINTGDLADNDIRVRLAPSEVFSRAGVDRLTFFNDLRFTPVFKGENSVIRVVSSQPVSEPYLNFIIEVERPTGQLYREYTVLLDPPGSSAYQSVSAVQSVSAAQTAAPAPRIAPAPAVMPKAEQGKGYSVVSGDSLWKIASRHAPSPNAVPSLMADIHALNPQAFVGGDMNRLRAGVQLRMPDRAQMPDTVPAPVATVPAQVAQESVTEPVEQIQGVEASAPVQAMDEANATAAVDPLLAEQVAQAAAQQLAQAEQTQKLQENLSTLASQVQQLQEQMTARDQQIALLQAELAEREKSAAAPQPAVAEPVAATTAQGAAAERNWVGGVAGLLGLLMAGVLALLWRRNRTTKPAPVAAQSVALSAAGSAAISPVYVRASQSDTEATAAARQAAPDADPMQTANVYIAYGHYREAAATLNQAWEADPQRGDIGFRYLEVLAELGDAQRYLELEPLVRATGFSAVRLDELKASHAQLFAEQPANLLADVELDDPAPKSVLAEAPDSPLNLDDFTLNADWDAVNPFAAEAPAKIQPVQHTAEIFDLADSRDARSPFAQTMLVEEAGHGTWKDDLSAELLELDLNLQDDEFESSVKGNIAKLNIAQAFIDQGNIDGACQVLNEIILEGDEAEQKEARDLLARIA